MFERPPNLSIHQHIIIMIKLSLDGHFTSYFNLRYSRPLIRVVQIGLLVQKQD